MKLSKLYYITTERLINRVRSTEHAKTAWEARALAVSSGKAEPQKPEQQPFIPRVPTQGQALARLPDPSSTRLGPREAVYNSPTAVGSL